MKSLIMHNSDSRSTLQDKNNICVFWNIMHAEISRNLAEKIILLKLSKRVQLFSRAFGDCFISTFSYVFFLIEIELS